MKRKAKTRLLAICLAVCLVLFSGLGSAFMREPSGAFAETEGEESAEIATFAATEDVTETVKTVRGASLEEGVFLTDGGLYFEYSGDLGGFVIIGAEVAYEGDGVPLWQACTDACIPEYIYLQMGDSRIIGYEEYTYPVVGIADEAFYGNTNLTSARIGKYVKYMGVDAFYNCTSLESIEYRAVDAENPSSSCPFAYAGGNAEKCELLIGAETERIDQYMFDYLKATNVTFEEGSVLREIGDSAFYGLGETTGVVDESVDFILPDTVEKVGKYGCAVKLTLDEANVPVSLREAGYAAFGYRDVRVLHLEAECLPDCDSSSSPFYGLSQEHYYGKNKWATGNGDLTLYIGREVTRIPDWCFAGETTMNNDGASAYITKMYPEYVYEGKNDDGGYSLEYIGSHAFDGCNYLYHIELPMGVEDVEPYAFSGTPVKDITLGDTENWQAETEDGTHVSSAVQVLFGSAYMSDPATVATYWKTTYCSYRFRCTDGFEYERSEDGTYYSVTGYTGDGGAVTVPETHRLRPVKEIAEGAFKNDAAVTSAVIPESVESIGGEAFYDCTKLASVTVSGEGLKTVGTDAFKNCSKLTSLYVSTTAAFVSVDYENRYANPLAVVSSNGGKFYVGGSSCTSLTVTDAERIGTYALAYCTIISDIVIGETVETVGSYAFCGNTAIKSVTIPSSVIEMGAGAFSSTNLDSVTFVRTGGWKIYDLSGNLAAEPSAAEVQSGAASLLSGTYSGYVWKNEKTNFLAPVITGASEDPEGFYTNTDISLYVSAAEGAYVTAVYWKAPGEDSYYSSEGDTLTLCAGDLVCGTYVFYAEDSDGNVSSNYYAVFDDVPPEIYATGATIFDGYVGEAFTVYASDNLSSVTLWYSYKGGDFVSAGGDSYAVLSSSGDGRYSFYAEDLAGNRCGEYTLILDTVQPVGRWEKEDHGTYALSFVWDDVSWSCEMNGSAYVSGTPITDEGSYTATLTTLSGNRESFTTELTHNYVVESVVTGNCEEGGTALFVCTYCGASYTAETAAAGSHSYTLEIVEPTCETDGYSVSVCTVCGAYDWSTYSYLSPLGHDVLETEISATCEKDGFRGAVCLRCGKEFEGETVPATGHLWYVSTYEAGCESEGYRETVCLRCSEVSSYEVIDPLGHDYREVSRTEATCEEAALVTYRCSRCSSEYEAYVGDAAEHDYSVVSVVRDSSCGVEGERRLTCSVCGDYMTEAIPALSHNNVETGRYKDSETGETFVTYTCSICGESFTVSIGNQEEAAASGVKGMMDTYTKYMWWILLATVAVWSIVMGVRYAMSRNSDDKAKAKSMIINYVIGIVVIAVILVACPYLVYAIALLAG